MSLNDEINNKEAELEDLKKRRTELEQQKKEGEDAAKELGS